MPDPTVAGRGPVLVCYRQDDGAAIAREAVRALRSVGVPVWVDENDMGVGRFDRTFRRAAEAGLAGAVFVATPNVTLSDFIRSDEAPVWDALANNPDFVLAIVNGGPDGPDGGPDYAFPSGLLALREQRLELFKQYPVAEDGWADRLVRDIAERRLHVLSAETPERELRVEVSTRDEPSSTRSVWELRATIGPSFEGTTVLGPLQVDQVRRLTRELPVLASRLQRHTLRVRGGFHLPVALAIGLAFPTVRPGRVVIEDNFGATWDSHVRGGSVDLDPVDLGAPDGDGDGVAVLVDFVPGQPADGFGRLAEHLRVPARVLTAAGRERLDAADGTTVAEQVADAIRDFAGTHATNRVHLCLRIPAALAVLIGRNLNTYRLSLYDFDRTADAYVRFSDAQAGGPTGNVITPEHP